MLVPRRSVFPPFSSAVVGVPRSYDCVNSWPSRQIVRWSHSDRALTTETPTPCRPPDTL